MYMYESDGCGMSGRQQKAQIRYDLRSFLALLIVNC